MGGGGFIGGVYFFEIVLFLVQFCQKKLADSLGFFGGGVAFFVLVS